MSDEKPDVPEWDALRAQVKRLEAALRDIRSGRHTFVGIRGIANAALADDMTDEQQRAKILREHFNSYFEMKAVQRTLEGAGFPAIGSLYERVEKCMDAHADAKLEAAAQLIAQRAADGLTSTLGHCVAIRALKSDAKEPTDG